VVTGLPSIQVVPSPAPIRGFIATTLVCILLFCGALATVFYLNTAMVQGSYEIREKQVVLNSLAESRNSLVDEIADASTATALRERAESLGLEPAMEIRHVDLGQRVVSAGGADNAQ